MPYECRNVKIGVLSGPSSQIKKAQLEGVFLDGHSLYMPGQSIQGDNSQRYSESLLQDGTPADSENAADWMNTIMSKQYFRDPYSTRPVTANSIWMKNETQRLSESSTAENGHYFGGLYVLDYSNWVKPGVSGPTTAYLQVTFDV